MPLLRETIQLEYNRVLKSFESAPDQSGVSAGSRRRSRFSDIDSELSLGRIENAKVEAGHFDERDELMLFIFDMVCR